MPVFVYRALDAKGRSHQDEIVAESAGAAREMLRARGLYPVDMRDGEAARAGARSAAGVWLRRERLTLPEMTEITRQLATLLEAGLQVVPAFSILIRQSRREYPRHVLTRIREAVNEGTTLAGAMEAFPRVFPPLYVNMVRAGERSGSLGPLLSRMADYLEHQYNLRRRLSGAMAYPAIMLLTGGGVLLFLFSFVVPNVVQIFRQARQDLPWATRFLIGVSGFLNAYLVFIALAGGALAVAGAAWGRTAAGRRFFQGLLLRVPLIGPILHKRAVSRFGRTLGVLITAGLPILEAIGTAKPVMANAVLEEAVSAAAERTRKGERFGTSLERTGLFPTLFTDMVQVGEQSGTLDRMLVHVSAQLDQETDAALQTMMSLVDPLLILIMGVVVGFVVVAILLPLFEISQLVR